MISCCLHFRFLHRPLSVTAEIFSLTGVTSMQISNCIFSPRLADKTPTYGPMCYKEGRIRGFYCGIHSMLYYNLPTKSPIVHIRLRLLLSIQHRQCSVVCKWVTRCFVYRWQLTDCCVQMLEIIAQLMRDISFEFIISYKYVIQICNIQLLPVRLTDIQLL